MGDHDLTPLFERDLANAIGLARGETGSQLPEGRHFGSGSCSSRDFAAVKAQTSDRQRSLVFFPHIQSNRPSTTAVRDSP
jgi:hypothetical protein